MGFVKGISVQKYIFLLYWLCAAVSETFRTSSEGDYRAIKAKEPLCFSGITFQFNKF